MILKQLKIIANVYIIFIKTENIRSFFFLNLLMVRLDFITTKLIFDIIS